MSAILLIVGIALIAYGFFRHSLLVFVIGVVCFVVGVTISAKKYARNRDYSDADSGLSDNWRLSDDREHHSAHSHHDSHDSGSDSGGDGGGGD